MAGEYILLSKQYVNYFSTRTVQRLFFLTKVNNPKTNFVGLIGLCLDYKFYEWSFQYNEYCIRREFSFYVDQG